MNRLIKCYPYQLGGSFLSGKASLALSGCLPSEDADYCMLINEWVWLRSQCLLIKSEVHFFDQTWWLLFFGCLYCADIIQEQLLV